MPGPIVNITPAAGETVEDLAIELPVVLVTKESSPPCPASTTTIDYSETATRNLRGYEDLLNHVTGVAANSFDQGGVGFGFVLRGFGEHCCGECA